MYEWTIMKDRSGSLFFSIYRLLIFKTNIVNVYYFCVYLPNIVLIFLQFALMVSENISLFVACSVVIIAICDFIIKDIRK